MTQSGGAENTFSSVTLYNFMKAPSAGPEYLKILSDTAVDP